MVQSAMLGLLNQHGLSIPNMARKEAQLYGPNKETKTLYNQGQLVGINEARWLGPI